jgi:hypothetical protein
VYILVVEAIERQKTGVEYAEINGITYLRVPTFSFGHTKQKCWFCPVIYSVAQSLVGILSRNNQACAQPQNVITSCVIYVRTNDATAMSLSRLAAKKREANDFALVNTTFAVGCRNTTHYLSESDTTKPTKSG